MKIVNKEIAKNELRGCENLVDDEMAKAVVDVGRHILAIDAPMHADLEQFLLEQGSMQDDLWGINLYFGDGEELIEYDSMINVRPRQGNRSRYVEDAAVRQEIERVVAKWIK